MYDKGSDDKVFNVVPVVRKTLDKQQWTEKTNTIIGCSGLRAVNLPLVTVLTTDTIASGSSGGSVSQSGLAK